jgi:hypothetical protein
MFRVFLENSCPFGGKVAAFSYIGVEIMDETFLREHAARCRSLADNADPFTKGRLLDLAAKYDERLLQGQLSRASRVIKLPDSPSRRG